MKRKQGVRRNGIIRCSIGIPRYGAMQSIRVGCTKPETPVHGLLVRGVLHPTGVVLSCYKRFDDGRNQALLLHVDEWFELH